MPFEVFDKRMTPLAKAPSVTIQKRGVISLNKAAHDLIDSAETVELLYDRGRQVIALRASDDSSPHAYAVRNGSKRGPGQAIVSATAFTTAPLLRARHHARSSQRQASAPSSA